MIKETGVKQGRIADMLGVHQNQVSRWVRGEQSPQGKNYDKLMKIIHSYNNLKVNREQ